MVKCRLLKGEQEVISMCVDSESMIRVFKSAVLAYIASRMPAETFMEITEDLEIVAESVRDYYSFYLDCNYDFEIPLQMHLDNIYLVSDPTTSRASWWDLPTTYGFELLEVM